MTDSTYFVLIMTLVVVVLCGIGAELSNIKRILNTILEIKKSEATR